MFLRNITMYNTEESIAKSADIWSDYIIRTNANEGRSNDNLVNYYKMSMNRFYKIGLTVSCTKLLIRGDYIAPNY